MDHYADCEDELNCDCANIFQCQTCYGYGTELDKDYCSNVNCEDGYEYINNE